MPFTKQTPEFLFENRLQNSKQWYHDHKKQYTDFVLTPLTELFISLVPTVSSIDDRIVCNPKAGGCISRIYRDTRFSKDKSLYRDNMWIVFMRDKESCSGYPGFYAEVSSTGYGYGCGYYEAGTETMQSIRRLILNGDPAFKTAIKSYEAQNTLKMYGDMYKKSRHPNEPENIRSWLDRKNIGFSYESGDINAMFSPSFANEIAEGFTLLAPMYHFLIKAETEKKLMT